MRLVADTLPAPLEFACNLCRVGRADLRELVAKTRPGARGGGVKKSGT